MDKCGHIFSGEIITTPKEMIDRIRDQVYDFVQPDVSVIGGIGGVMEVFEKAFMSNAYRYCFAPNYKITLLVPSHHLMPYGYVVDPDQTNLLALIVDGIE